MAIKNVVVVVDDFTDATLTLWDEDYGIEIWDYGTFDYEAQLVDIDGYAYGAILYEGSISSYDPLYVFTPNEPGVMSLWDENLNGNSYDDLSSDYFFIESYPVDDVYGFITNTDLDTPFIANPSEWGHGDMLRKIIRKSRKPHGHLCPSY